MKIQIVFLFMLWTVVPNVWAQTGTIRGVINDGEFNDVLPFANVIVKGSEKGVTSDFDGVYEISIEPGIYTLEFSFVGYQTTEITDVEVKPHDITVVNTTLSPESAQLEEVVLTASTNKNTEASLVTAQKKSVVVMNGISSEGLVKTGAGNAAAAVKSVPGVSVQGGKYVFVRGLGDRYTKSILNGIEIPGLDPDRNTIQMDIFPSGILDNIQVTKSASAHLPADFTGGIVNIITKDFPVRPTLNISMGGEFNPDMHFNNNFLSAHGSSTDWLGYDNGLRDLPIDADLTIPHPTSANGSEVTGITKSFNPNLSVLKSENGMNYSFSASGGNQYNVGNNKLGIMASLDYKNKTKFYDNAQNNTFFRDEDENIIELSPDKTNIGPQGVKDVLLSGLAGVAYKRNKSKYKLNVLHIQNGEETASYYNKTTRISDAKTEFRDLIYYTQRSISNILLNGIHTFKEGKLKIDWNLSPTRSIIEDKDIRLTPFKYESDNNAYIIETTNAPTRTWRNLNEVNWVGKLDSDLKHQVFGNQAKLSVGGNYILKDRDFDIYSYLYKIAGNSYDQNFNGVADNLLLPEHIWTEDTDEGTFIQGEPQPENSYSATQQIIAGYLSEEFQANEKLKAILGLRLEQFDVFYTGEGLQVYDNKNIINELNLFPSANLIYTLKEDHNVRLSYSKTTARPSFKEASIAQIYDPLSDRTFIGNVNLKPTYVDNIDLRFEKYGEGSEMLGFSVFYKYFDNPIELTIFGDQAPSNFTPRNVTNGKVYGAELEFRKKLGFIGLEHFDINLNASFIKSLQKMNQEEYLSRLENARAGEDVKDTRELQGQSPYLINAVLSYKNEQGWQSNLSYNVQGETLEVVGIGSVPDVYTLPYNSINLNVSKSFGKDQRSKLKLQATNLLNESRESVYKSYKAKNQLFSYRNPGTSFSLSYSYKFK
jgi:TonB-dependent receptor